MNRVTKQRQLSKLKKPNAFITFVMEFKQKLIDKGNDVPDLKRLTEIASPHWENLSPEEKEKYKKISLQPKPGLAPILTPVTPRLNSSGVNFHEENARLLAERKANENMVNFIKNLVVKACDSGELETLVFYFIATTSFFTNSADIFPAELALAKFSLKEGIIDDFQVRINPGKLPLGSSLKALEKAENTHLFPLPPNCEGEDDYLVVLEKIIKFLHPLDKFPIFFTNGNTRDDLEPMLETCRTLKKIFFEAHEDAILKDVKVYPIDELLFMLQKVAVMNRNAANGTSEASFPSITHASNKFKVNGSERLVKGCDFHSSKNANNHCCLSKVRRFGSIISNFCSAGKNFELKKGEHHPRSSIRFSN